MNIAIAQRFMQERGIDGWLVHDFRGNNMVLGQLLPGKRWTTRRAVLWVPARGEGVVLAHGIDAGQFKDVAREVKGVRVDNYLSWRELHEWLKRILEGVGRVAMEYAPGAMLPVVSMVDAGTVELVRSCGVEVVSSADLIQATVAVWSDEAVRVHAVASSKVAGIKDAAFGLIRERVSGGGGGGRAVNEYEVQQFIMGRFKEEGLETPDPPIVAVNAHAADPHFEVSSSAPTPIRKGDWVLIDLWARVPGDENIYSDITWVGCCGQPSARQREVFGVVKRARDASVKLAQEGWAAKRVVQGWQLDEAARGVIIGAGFEKFIRHRTGHSLSPGALVHGMGMNLDNLETRDTRAMLPGIGFTVEPGVYIAEEGFGVRLEINLWVDPAKGPVVTSCVQEDVLVL